MEAFIPREKISKTVRRIPDSTLNYFGRELANYNWDCLDQFSTNPTEMASLFEHKMNKLTNTHFPLKKITISSFDQPFFTEELRDLRRK